MHLEVVILVGMQDLQAPVANRHVLKSIAFFISGAPQERAQVQWDGTEGEYCGRGCMYMYCMYI